VLDEPKSTVIGTRHIKHYALSIEKSPMKKLNSAKRKQISCHTAMSIGRIVFNDTVEIVGRVDKIYFTCVDKKLKCNGVKFGCEAPTCEFV
jgi:hypothetical protein